MDGARDIDIETLRSSIRSVDHLLVRFTPVAERLLFDFRASAEAGPGVELLPPASSFAERMRSIERARPGFPPPKRLHVVSWPLGVASLERLGVLETVRARLAAMDAFEVIPRVGEIHERLLDLERTEYRRAIEGEGYHTIWPAAAGRRRGA